MKAKQWAARIDNLLFGGQLQKWFLKTPESKYQESLASGLEYRIVSHYQKDSSNQLAKLCDLYGSDKGELTPVGHPYAWRSHTYTDYYSRLFSHSRQSVSKVFECGLGTSNPDIPSSMGIKGKPGASLRVWKDYFPNAQIWGGDIDTDVLFQEERIKTYHLDQLDRNSIQQFWKQVGQRDFDFILDDGLHTFEAGSSLFENSIDYLAMSGIYVIEDVAWVDLVKYKEFFMNSRYLVDFVLLFGPDVSLVDNNLVVIRKMS